MVQAAQPALREQFALFRQTLDDHVRPCAALVCRLSIGFVGESAGAHHPRVARHDRAKQEGDLSFTEVRFHLP